MRPPIAPIKWSTIQTLRVAYGVGLVGRAGDALQQIIAKVGGINGVVKDIAASTQEQSAGLAQVNTAINQMDHPTKRCDGRAIDRRGPQLGPRGPAVGRADWTVQTERRLVRAGRRPCRASAGPKADQPEHSGADTAS